MNHLWALSQMISGDSPDAKKALLEETTEADHSAPDPEDVRIGDERDEIWKISWLNIGRLYERSFMHTSNVNFVRFCNSNGFLITIANNGSLKFWAKKTPDGIEFVKHFQAHVGNILNYDVNYDETLLITIGVDKFLKVYSITDFDMINVVMFDKDLKCCTWIYGKGDVSQEIAIAFNNCQEIHIFDYGYIEAKSPMRIISTHFAPIQSIAFDNINKICFSTDEKGILNFWHNSSQDFEFPKKHLNFEFNSDTDFFEFVTNNFKPTSMQISPDCEIICFRCSDDHIRIYDIKEGKKLFEINESTQCYVDNQNLYPEIPNLDFGHKVVIEKELDKSGDKKLSNIIFDSTSRFLIFASLAGIRVLDLQRGEFVNTSFGPNENIRFLNISLFEKSGKDKLSNSIEMLMNRNNEQASKNIDDPTIVATGFNNKRFFLFTKRLPLTNSGSQSSSVGRDIYNEKPSHEEILTALKSKEQQKINKNSEPSAMAESAVIHTTMGDINVNFFKTIAPRAVENFTKHSENKYFNNHIFHRVIKGFIIQTGDPIGTGTGGESIWGDEFEDEFDPNVKHDRPYMLSMANAGKNTNGSQFFITLMAAPFLDNKHTIFGEVKSGTQVVHNINKIATDSDTDKPLDDVKIVSITLKY
ncbi:MAG: Peptidylprolyl isomerase domain and WD repeat containing protein 1 [Marteilia pararefringens]